MCNRCGASPSPRVQSDSPMWGCFNQPPPTPTPTATFTYARLIGIIQVMLLQRVRQNAVSVTMLIPRKEQYIAIGNATSQTGNPFSPTCLGNSTLRAIIVGPFNSQHATTLRSVALWLLYLRCSICSLLWLLCFVLLMFFYFAISFQFSFIWSRYTVINNIDKSWFIWDIVLVIPVIQKRPYIISYLNIISFLLFQEIQLGKHRNQCRLSKYKSIVVPFYDTFRHADCDAYKKHSGWIIVYLPLPCQRSDNEYVLIAGCLFKY